MIPLRDSIRPRRYPFVNIGIILINIAVFVYQLGMGSEELMQFFTTYGVVPQRLTLLLDTPLRVELWLPLFSSMFLHGGWLHLLGNMLYLWVFGDNVEDRLGHSGYLLFYLLAGAAGGLFHVAANPLSTVPTIGASGAVAAILGAYFIFYPGARVLTLVPIFFILTTIELPAMIFLFLWFFLQLFNAFLAGVAPGAQTVAWWAHIGGFVVGFIVALLVLFWRRLMGVR